MFNTSWRYILSEWREFSGRGCGSLFGCDELKNAFGAWNVVPSCPLDSLPDSQGEGFEGRLGPGRDA